MIRKILLGLIVASIFIIPDANAEYYSHHKWYHTFDVINKTDTEYDGVHPNDRYNAIVDQHAVDQAVKLWASYGINLIQVKSGGDFHIKFAYFCELPYLGYYDEDSKNAVIFTFCHRQDFSEDLKTHIIAHEIGHALGWSHSSDLWFMKSEYSP